MSKQTEKLYQGITGIRDDLIEQAEQIPTPKKVIHWKRWTALAACAAVVVGISGTMLLRGGLDLDGSNAGSGGSGHAEGSVFLSYAGPVFPLTALENGEALTAQRNVTYDFSLLGTQMDWDTLYQQKMTAHNVSDSYVLTNPTDTEQTVTLCYPSAGSLSDPANRLPTILVNSEKIDTVLSAGPYSGGFKSADGDEKGTDTLNLDEPTSWKEYRNLLEDGSYLTSAMDVYPVLNQTVTVYELTDEVADQERWPAATLEFSFHAARSITKILTWGFNGFSWDDTTNAQGYSYFVPKEGESDHGRPRYLIAIGEDIGDYTIQGYQNGGCDVGTEIEVTAKVQRYETTLEKSLCAVMAGYLTRYGDQEEVATIQAAFSEDDLLGLSAELLVNHGVLADNPTMRYDTGMLEDTFSETLVQERIFYQTFTATIPAGGSVKMTAQMFKDASYDFACSGSDNVGVNGYDLVTTLGSSLKFTDQTATLTNTQGIEIVRQNFGFDLADGVTSVTLDTKQEHYYLEVREVSLNE